MYQRILVPLDGTPVGDDVLAHASTLARNSHAELILLRILSAPTPDPLFQTPWVQSLADQKQEPIQLLARGSLERIADKLRAQGLRVSTRIATGRPVDAIQRTAASTQTDVIVMSGHGLKVDDPWPDSRVAARVLNEARVPVFLIGGRHQDASKRASSEIAERQG